MPENIGSASRDAASEGATDFKAPTISLPQGGGALRGIDEKFTANPVTGAGALTVPIATSKARSGTGLVLRTWAPTVRARTTSTSCSRARSMASMCECCSVVHSGANFMMTTCRITRAPGCRIGSG